MTPMMFMFPVIAFFVGLLSMRWNGKLKVGGAVVLLLGFGKLMIASAHVGHFDYVGTVIMPALTIVAFVVGLIAHSLIRRAF
jgi:hypothetical protein